MIKIDDLYYECNISERKVNLGRGFEDVIVLEIEEDFDNISIIKTERNIYKIGDILKIIKDENIYWLQLLSKSENLDNVAIDKLQAENNSLKADLEKAKTSSAASMVALVEVNNRLNKLEKEVKSK